PQGRENEESSGKEAHITEGIEDAGDSQDDREPEARPYGHSVGKAPESHLDPERAFGSTGAFVHPMALRFRDTWISSFRVRFVPRARNDESAWFLLLHRGDFDFFGVQQLGNLGRESLGVFAVLGAAGDH